MKIPSSKINKCFQYFIIMLIILTAIYILCKLGDRKSTTMKEAYNIAYKAVSEENPGVLLLHMSSTDSIKKPEDKKAGRNGLRRYWNLIFAVPNTTENWIIQIKNHKIYTFEKITNGIIDKSYLIDNMESLINSKEALKIAKHYFIIKPGEVWAIGYHFTIGKEGSDTIISVFCRDKDNNFTKISINAETKEIINAIHKVPVGNDEFRWEKLNMDKHKSNTKI